MYRNGMYTNCPFFLEDGTHQVPTKNTVIENIPLDSGFSFSGQIFEEPMVDEEKEIVIIHLTNIQISRDGILHSRLTSGSIADILVSNKNHQD
jgi:hypothetical protein